MDYVSVFTILTFPECANKSCVNIIILDDMTVEKNETMRDLVFHWIVLMTVSC